ncbi:sensor histidine kinase [Streptoalloteichus hindustanus]|uniref:histidine kinase n=1 Tax=Streptoalloteichus hindustanus TaxID=2017 RepID=A0A1M5LP81_STRHI|nr:HAMP domain-containing sensor histidine kinase [Streptoalloteichus hindustanus]SHG66766.1 Signal transduction histidine kinase [Streptoalloteichus hindustanus]
MRRRVLLALLAFSVLAVAAFAVPLLGSTAAERTQQLVIARTADLDRFAVLADQAAATGDATTLRAEVERYTELYGEPVVVVDARRAPVVETGGMRAAEPTVAGLVDGALRNQPAEPLAPLRPWSREDVLLARPAGTGTKVSGAVVLRASVRATASDVASRWALVLLGTAAAAVACVFLALVMTRWVLRPLRELERGVRAVAAGRGDARVAAGGPPELRQLATQFNQMSDAVAEASEQQRQLVADASHQLRNPMAALRLRIDALGAQVPESGRRTYRSVESDLERMEALLDDMLALANVENRAARLSAGRDVAAAEAHAVCDAAAVATAQVDAWRSAAEQAGVTLRLAVRPALARCAEDELAQVLGVLVDNAVKYAGRGATVEVRCAREDDVVRLTVVDDGPGMSADELRLATRRFWRADRHRGTRGTGLGLPIAERMVSGRGGRLELRSAGRRHTTGGQEHEEPTPEQRTAEEHGPTEHPGGLTVVVELPAAEVTR